MCVAEIDRRVPCTRSVSEDIWGQKLQNGRRSWVEDERTMSRRAALSCGTQLKVRVRFDRAAEARALTFGGARPAMFSSAVPCTYVYPEARARQFLAASD